MFIQSSRNALLEITKVAKGNINSVETTPATL